MIPLIVILKIYLINFICVYIIDFSGIIIDISKLIWTWRFPKKEYLYWIIPKPFSCSVCATFWLTLGYCLFIKGIIVSLSIACLSALLTDLTKRIINYYKLKTNE